MRDRYGMGLDWWTGRFRGYGWRVTIPRQVILDVLSKTSKYLSAEDIYLAVHRIYPAIGLSTVYRTLDLLIQMGLVFKYDFGDSRARYELDRGAEGRSHHHLVCTGCNSVIDHADFIEDEVDSLKKTEKGLSEKYNFKILRHTIQFYGLCDKCQMKASLTERSECK
jgi:Fur family ferric uptake transcriptional regulator